jgi:hypothetical protein
MVLLFGDRAALGVASHCRRRRIACAATAVPPPPPPQRHAAPPQLFVNLTSGAGALGWLLRALHAPARALATTKA